MVRPLSAIQPSSHPLTFNFPWSLDYIVKLAFRYPWGNYFTPGFVSSQHTVQESIKLAHTPSSQGSRVEPQRFISCLTNINTTAFKDEQTVYQTNRTTYLFVFQVLYVIFFTSHGLSLVKSKSLLKMLTSNVTILDVSQKKFVDILTAVTWFSGILCTVFSCLKAALSLFGMLGAPMLGLFTLGMIFPWANSKVSQQFYWKHVD